MGVFVCAYYGEGQGTPWESLAVSGKVEESESSEWVG